MEAATPTDKETHPPVWKERGGGGLLTNLTIGSFELFYVLDISLKSFFFRAPYEKRLKATKIRKFFWKGTWSRFHPSHCKRHLGIISN